MKNKLPNLSEQEKIDFLASNYEESAKYVKSQKRFIFKMILGLLPAPLVAGLMISLANPGVVGLFLEILKFGYLIVLPMCAILGAGLALNQYHLAHYEFKTLSNGKISYKQYKQLVKSGELDKWKQELNNKNIVVEEYKSKQIPIASKEFAEKVVGVIQENNRNNSNDLQK